MKSEKSFRRPLSAVNAGALVATLACVIGMSPEAGADRLYYKNGKSLEGLIKAERPNTIEFIYQGREMRIPRDRIDRIERGDPMENVDMMLTKAKEAMDQDDMPAAKELLAQAREMAPTGERLDRLNALDADLQKSMELGSAGQRRKKAEALLAEATELIDRVETQKGSEALLKALEMDPSLEAAHDLMAKFMNGRQPNIIKLAGDYFADSVIDPGKIKPDHPIIRMLPEIYVNETVELQDAESPDEIARRVERLKKLSTTFDERPEWAKTNAEAQKRLIELRAFGIVSEQIEEDFKARKFDRAEVRLRALGNADDNPAMGKLYIRVNVARANFEEAKKLLEAQRGPTSNAPWIDQSINALDFYLKADEAKKAGNHKDARAVLDRLFQSKDKFTEIPEIVSLVAAAKVGYDITAMENSEGENPIQTADLAVQIHSYAIDEESKKKAAETFARVAGSLKYKIVTVWIVDDVEIPFLEDWNSKMKNLVTSRFAQDVDDASPFTLTVRIVCGTPDAAGARLLDAAQKTDTLSIDFFNPDSGINKLRVELMVSHPAEPNLYSTSMDHVALPEPVRQARENNPAPDLRHQQGAVIFLDLTQLNDFTNWIDNDLAYYMPDALSLLGASIKLDKDKTEKSAL